MTDSIRRPNILLITADDMDVGTPAAFGGPEGITPRLDDLARSGMVFLNAHVVAAVCQPSRSAIMTGLLPHHNGAEGFEPVADGVPLLNDSLREVGYRLGILGKVDHLQPVERFAWNYQKGMRELGMGRSPAEYRSSTAEFLAGCGDAPWFLMANAHDPHRPFHGSADERSKFNAEERDRIPDPDVVVPAGAHPVPGFLPDLGPVRAEYAQYLNSARRCDQVVGAVLDAVAGAGAKESTVVFFLSDNGMSFPFAKANCYLRSTLTPFIVRWPGVIRPGARDERSAFTTLDLLPTFCEIAGAPTPARLDGRTLVPALRGRAVAGDGFVFTVFHETAGRRRFEMRCVQDRRYGYIWNAWSDGTTEYAAENMQGLSWPAMAASGNHHLAERASFYRLRTPEEFYDLRTDPDALHNLVDHPEVQEELARYRRLLSERLAAAGDPLAERYRESAGSRAATRAERS